MGFIASDSGGGGDFKRVPSGNFVARCYWLVDLGTQHSTGQYGEKDQHKIQIGWELFGEDDEGNPLTVEYDGKTVPMTIRKRYTVSLHEKSSLRRDLASWRGKDFTEEEAKAFDVSKLIGAYCMVNVTVSENNGKTYSNVSGITKLPSALKDSKPAAVHQNVMFDMDDPDMEVFNSLHDSLKETIRSAPEFKGDGRAASSPVAAFEDDIPW